ncbi:MAG: DNA repair protein RadA [Alphaproteobacteria bacterium]|nr:DNA repair protein RadA [Alphaproteobacteria bacterium]
MPKTTTAYVCQQCGAASPKWAGKCEACGSWNSLQQEEVIKTASTQKMRGGGKIAIEQLTDNTPEAPRQATGFSEVDRVLGGGLVPASAILIGGDPGIGKSTLLLQLMCKMAAKMPCLYLSGEEAVAQIRLRAKRLGLQKAPLALATENSVDHIIASLKQATPDIVVVDSIQTMSVGNVESAPGTVAQVRASALELISAAKKMGFVLLLVGHVTKEGMIAGPKVLEHMVDTVLYLEGDRGHQFRILRAAKNRFGPTDEIGVFDMGPEGLQEVTNPSALFLSETRLPVPGTIVFAGLEGTRPVLCEVQALLSPSYYGTPRRASVGWDLARLNLILAVLETRLGIAFGQTDVYLNMAGGIKISEPAADLAVAAALLSAHFNTPWPTQQLAFGEVGLTGEIRPVAQADLRLKEASKLGFTGALIPAGSKYTTALDGHLAIQSLSLLQDLPAMLTRKQKAA